MQHFLTMANYNMWANRQYFSLCSKLSEEDYKLDRKVFFRSIHNTLNHILLVDILWMARLKGSEPDIHSLDQILHDDFESLQAARTLEDQHLLSYLNQLENSSLKNLIVYRRFTGNIAEETVEDILLTLFTHQVHHRGQVHAMLTQSSYSNSEMPDLDLVNYLDEASLSV